jgi:hypothetical protein
MPVSQLNVSPGVGNIFPYGDNRTDTGIGSFIEYLGAIRVKRRVTDVGVGVNNLMLLAFHPGEGAIHRLRQALS